MEPVTTLPIGFRLGDEYEIVGVLGAGGFGNTYIAHDEALGRDVAIKEYFPREIAHREANLEVRYNHPRFERAFAWGLERFIQEAKLLAKFRHPNIVRVFRTLDANNTGYIVLDYIRGLDFEAWLAALDERPTQEDIDELLAPLLDALALVHQIGILHRDIKPANICIREETGDPILLDFGASKYSMGELTGTTMAIVSRGYSPYEAYASDSGSQGPWTDIYGLGATFYRALLDTVPPEATERLLGDTLVPLKSAGLEGYRKEFLEAIDWALSVQPKQRPASVAEWRTALFRGASTVRFTWQPTSDSTTPRPSGPATPTEIDPATKKPSSKSSGIPLGMIAAAVVVVAGGAYGISQMSRSPLGGGGVGTALQKPIEQSNTTVAAAPVKEPKVESVKPTDDTKVAIATEAPPATAPPTPPPPPKPSYTHTRLTPREIGGSLSAVAVSADGRHIAVGSETGALKQFDTATGGEIPLGRLQGPIVAVDFVPLGKGATAAVGGDGRIVLIDPAAETEKVIGTAVAKGGFVKALAFNGVVGELVAIDSTGDLTRMSRWSPQATSSEPKALVEITKGAARAAAVSKTTDFAAVVGSDERIRGFRVTTGFTDDTFSFVPAAREWTTSLALAPANGFLARGGHYDTVEIFDGRAKSRKSEISLGDRARTLSLAFSDDGSRLAIDYTAYVDRVAAHRLRVVDTATGRQLIDIARPHDDRRWVSFLPGAGAEYWLAASAHASIGICRADEKCRLDQPPR